MHRIRTALVLLLTPVLLSWPAAADAVTSSGARWHWPLAPVPHVVRAFQAPDGAYGAGHRGVDLAGTIGQPVLAIGAGTVTFAGSVAGRGVVVVDHGSLRSTYEPVTPHVHVGDLVVAGQPLATLQGLQSHCAPQTCLHLGVRRAATYIDPLRLFGALPVRLKPLRGLLAPAASTARSSPAVSTRSLSSNSSLSGALAAANTTGPAVTAAGLATLVLLRHRARRRRLHSGPASSIRGRGSA